MFVVDHNDENGQAAVYGEKADRYRFMHSHTHTHMHDR